MIGERRERIFRIEKRDGGAAVIWFDVPGQSTNTLKADFAEALERVLTELHHDSSLQGIVLASGKPDSFIVGADVGMLQGVETAEQATELARTAQQTMNRVADFRLPIVAAIHGACLGGGLELALACDGRIASNRDETKLGQPEVQLGVIPGAGGTQRLPRLIGIESALDLILTGKPIPAVKAHKLGLVDDVVHPAVLIDVAAHHALNLARKGQQGAVGRLRDTVAGALPRNLKALLLEDNPAGRKILFDQAKERVLKKTHGNMPAPLEALKAVRVGVEEDMEAGLRAEAEAFGHLVAGRDARNLMRLFFARNELKKETGVDSDARPREVHKIAVLGAGLMGSGISYVTVAKAGIPVRLKDVDNEPLRDGLRSIRRQLDERVKKGRIDERERDDLMMQIRPTTDYSGFGRVDLVIEAVVEDLDVKHAVLREVEEQTKTETIFASNTSSLSISRIAEASAHPETVVGMHYFSPVPAVPLLEVVVGEKTADWVTATAVELGKRQGKTVIVVNDGVGFYTTRVLVPYLNEAIRILLQGVAIEQIDEALTGYGFPVGPLKLLDEVGIDVGAKIARILQDEFGERMAAPPAMQKVVDDSRQGRKNGRGFYKYQRKDGRYQRSDGPDPTIYDLLDVEPNAALAADVIAQRCVLQLVNEAARCYEEGILHNARDGDVGAVFGLGFPPFLGGPLRYADEQGAHKILGQLRGYQEQYGPHFAPAPILETLAEQDRGFHDA